MGYDTKYSLNIEPFNQTPEDNQALPDICAIAQFLTTFSATTPDRGFDANYWVNVLEDSEPTRWYHHEEDMEKISNNWPGYLFTLRGVGEDTDDQWIAYFSKGQTQIHRMPDWKPPLFEANPTAGLNTGDTGTCEPDNTVDHHQNDRDAMYEAIANARVGLSLLEQAVQSGYISIRIIAEYTDADGSRHQIRA